MENKAFAAWCRAASEKIRYGPDREAVRAELQAHLEDKYDALVARGMDPEEAANRALADMGSAGEIAPQLAAIHRPWLGYLYSTVRLIGIWLAVIAGFAVLSFWKSQIWGMLGGAHFDSLSANYDHIVYYCKPDVHDHEDGYHFAVTEAAITDDAMFYMELQVTWWPWMEEFEARDQIWAIDSRGNCYESLASAQRNDTVGWVFDEGYSGGMGHYNYRFGVTYFDTEAEWVEFHYDRDGRDIVLRIDLTGGDGA